MQRVIAEIRAISAARKADWHSLTSDPNFSTRKKSIVNECSNREKQRSDVEKIGFSALRKQKIMEVQLKQKMTNALLEMIRDIDPQILEDSTNEILQSRENNCEEGQSEIQMNQVISLVELLAHKMQLHNRQMYFLARPNNAFLLVDCLDLVSRVGRKRLKQSLFEQADIFPRPTIQRPSESRYTFKKQMSNRELNSLNKRLKTEAARNNQMNPPSPPTVSIQRTELQGVHKPLRPSPRQQFESDHCKYMHLMRLEFLNKFCLSEYEEKLNTLFIKTMNLNTNNKDIISGFLQKCYTSHCSKLNSTCDGDKLYSNEQKKRMLQKIEKQREEYIRIENMPKAQSNSASIQSTVSSGQLRQFIDNYIENHVSYTVAMRMNQKRDLVGRINQWLPLSVRVTSYLLEPLRYVFLGIDNQHKDKQTIFKEQLSRSLDQQSLGNQNSLLNQKQTAVGAECSKINNPFRPKNSRYQKEIVGCFSRRKLRDILEGPAVLSTKKPLIHHSNTSVILPTLSSGSIAPTCLPNNKIIHQKRRRIDNESHDVGIQLNFLLKKKSKDIEYKLDSVNEQGS